MLRDVLDTDVPVFFAQQSDPQANLLAGVPARDHDAFMSHWKTKVLRGPGVVVRAILYQGEVAGNILSWEKDGRQLVGYWIGRAYWGKGIATDALTEFLEQIPTRPLYAHVARHNPASARVLEKCGFEILRQGKCFSKAHGHEIDEVVFICR